MPKRPSISLSSKRAPEPASETVSVQIPPQHAHWKQHTHVKATFYLPPRLHEELRKLAFEWRRSQQDLFIEGIDLLLQHKCGKTIREVIEKD
jgi:hypothetical protein